jgi:hypothetical protein
VLRHRGLRNAELRGDDLDDFARRQLAARQELEDTSPHWIGEDLEGVHRARAYCGE